MLNSLMMISLNSPKPFSDEAKDLIKAAVQRHQEIFQTSHVIQHKIVFLAVTRELSSESTYSNKLVNTFCFTCHYCYFRWLSVTKRRQLPLTMIPKERQVQPETTGPNVREADVEEGGLEEDEETNEEVEIVESEDQQQVEEQQAEKAFQLFHLPSDESVTVVIKMMMMTVTMTATELSSLMQTNSILRSHTETIISHTFEIPCSFSEIP